MAWGMGYFLDAAHEREPGDKASIVPAAHRKAHGQEIADRGYPLRIKPHVVPWPEVARLSRGF